MSRFFFVEIFEKMNYLYGPIFVNQEVVEDLDIAWNRYIYYLNRTMFSKTCEYGLRASVFIAIRSEEGSRLGIKEIAREIESPMYFTGKILQSLVKSKIIGSAKGPHGGFYLDPDDEPVSILQILEALDCDDFFYNCALGLKECAEKYPCPIHNQFKPYREGLKELLARTTIQDLATEIREGRGHITNMQMEVGKKLKSSAKGSLAKRRN